MNSPREALIFTFNDDLSASSSLQASDVQTPSSFCKSGDTMPKYFKRFYKTELCKKFLSSPVQYCEYGSRCQFAHGVEELRVPVRHIRYKTELCQAYHTVGICPFDIRCNFIHNESSERLILIRSQVENNLNLNAFIFGRRDMSILEYCAIRKPEPLNL